MSNENTRWSPGLVGFYVGCGMVSLGAAIAFSGWFVFRDGAQIAATTLGTAMVVLGFAAMLFGLRAARKE